MSRHALSSRPRPAPPTATSCRGRYLLVEHAADRPDEAGQFTRDGRELLVRPDACAQMSVPVVEPQLSSPGQFDDGWWGLELALLERDANSRSMSGVMCCFAKDVAQQTVARPGDGTAVLLAATGTFGRY